MILLRCYYNDRVVMSMVRYGEVCILKVIGVVGISNS
jgi:hypothetical protein